MGADNFGFLEELKDINTVLFLTFCCSALPGKGVNQTRTTTDCLPRFTGALVPEIDVNPVPPPKSISAQVSLKCKKKHGSERELILGSSPPP